ncbi:MAG: hypothetical protein GY821_11625 [Gammaproteobacteria bacterium]|nr:hypothetical protein [Gammaproteobacteria bacterium]
MAKKVRKKPSKQTPTWLDPFAEEEEEGGESGSSSGGSWLRGEKPQRQDQLTWKDLIEEDEDDDGGDSGSSGWLIDEESLSEMLLGTIAEDISKQHDFNQEQSFIKDSPGGDGPGLSIQQHPLISFNGVDGPPIERIQSMTEDERSTNEFSNEYQHNNQKRLSKRLSASSAPTLTRSR